ncbi:hypothetical protein ACF5W4_17925 [Bacillota bacterium Lsc_1132]
MKLPHIIMILLIFAWPLYYLYERQLGAVSFLLLALLFLFITIREVKKLKQQDRTDSNQKKEEKIKRGRRLH